MRNAAHPPRLLAIDPTSRGFGFVILEGPATLVDWGVKSSRSAKIEKEIEILSKITDLIKHFQPDRVILEKTDSTASRRCGRIRLLLASIQNLAAWENIKAQSMSPAKVKQVFLTFGARTKQEIAGVVAEQLPELAPRLPRVRKPWMSEDYRMAIFDAAAFALTYYYSRPVRSGSERQG